MTSMPTFHDLLASPGVRYINLAHQRSFSVNIFSGNADELEAALEEACDPEKQFALLGDDNREQSQQQHRELARLLHNFLAAAMTLVDHTRVFVDEHYLGTAVKKAFRSRVESSFTNNPLTRFVQDLRNYMVHRGLPPSQKHFTLKRNETSDPPRFLASSGFQLEVRKLKEWSGWKADSKRFLDLAGETLDVAPLVKDYRTIIEAFHNDFDDILHEHHQEDIRQAEELQQLINGPSSDA